MTGSAYACVRTLLSAGHRIIFDCVILNEKGARALLSGFQGFRPILVGLTCSLEETKRRTLARKDRTLEEAEYGFRNSGQYIQQDYAFETTSVLPSVIASQLAEHVRRRERAAPGAGGVD